MSGDSGRQERGSLMLQRGAGEAADGVPQSRQNTGSGSQTMGTGREGVINRRGSCVENTVRSRADHLYEV